MSIDHYPHIIPDIGEMDKFWEFFGFWAERYGCVLRCLKEGAEGDKHFTDYEVSSLDVMSDVFAKIRERGRDFIREPDEFECCYYKLSVPNKGTDEIYCLPFDDKMFACEFREKFGFVS